jgi:CRP-like cAMP-binding protein
MARGQGASDRERCVLSPLTPAEPVIFTESLPHDLLIRQIETVSRLTPDARTHLRDLPFRTRLIEENRDVFREGQRATECCVILSGLACRYKIVGGGRRQILSLHFAGDVPDLQSLLLDKMDHNLGMLTAGAVAFIPHEAIRALSAKNPSVAEALGRQALVDGSIFREWIANVGRRIAIERIAHLICECFTRMRALGLADNDSFDLQMTQAELGDATGLSNVHVNRTMQSLKKAGIIGTEGRSHKILDWRRLQETGDFDPAYLHLVGATSLI